MGGRNTIIVRESEGTGPGTLPFETSCWVGLNEVGSLPRVGCSGSSRG